MLWDPECECYGGLGGSAMGSGLVFILGDNLIVWR